MLSFEMTTKHLLRVQAIVNNIKYKDWRLNVILNEGRLHLQWAFKAPNWTEASHPVVSWTSRKWPLSEHMVESEIVQTALMAALTAEEHEARETFHYLGTRPFHPHISLEHLMRASAFIEARSQL
jgi:hypothetical protein